MDRPTIVQVQELTKSYSGKAAVDGLTFQLSAGRILGLVGPNGAGKTTTLRMLAGIITPSVGIITINGSDIKKNALSAKRITGYVPDEPNLFESLTIWEHIEFTASVYRLTDFAGHARELLERFQLTTRRNEPVQELSLGMRQKVAICCAYLIKPQLLIFDEPLTGLDPQGIREISHSISEIASGGSAVIISSHLLGLVENLCTDVLLLREGQQLLAGSLDDVLNRMHVKPGTSAETLEAVFFRTLKNHENSHK